jgi:hypothetical protein
MPKTRSASVSPSAMMAVTVRLMVEVSSQLSAAAPARAAAT